MRSSRVTLSALRPRLPTSPHGSRGNLNDRAGGHRSVRAESDNRFGDNLTDEFGSVVRRKRRCKIVVEADGFAKATLASGHIVLLDLDDIGLIHTHYLHFHTQAATPYVVATDMETGRSQRLGRLLMEPSRGFVADHINGDGLDNRRCNLRVITSQQNNQNRAKMRGTSSRFKGVSRRGKRWFACLYENNRQIRLGLHDTEIDAAVAYDAAARVRFGDCAALNFPLAGEQSAHRRDSFSTFHSPELTR